MDKRLNVSPCPFCGDTSVYIKENTYWTGMRSKVVSVELYHWCNKYCIVHGCMKWTFKTEEDAIDFWEKRVE